MKNKIMLFYPPGMMFQRGEDRCQQNIKDASAEAMRACNDLGYGAAILLKRGYEVRLRDFQTEGASLSDMYEEFDAFKPDLIMMSITNTTIFDDLKLIKEIREKYDPVIVLKGALFYDPEQEMLDLLDLSPVDYMIGGEVDFAIGEIADLALKGEGNVEDILSILYKKEDGSFGRTKFHVWGEDLDSRPFPARELMNNALYKRPDTDEPMATIQTGRGCPSSCVFCLTPVISGKCVRMRSPQNVMDELTECYEKHGIRNFFFKADTFTINPAWVKEMCERIINSPLHGKIAFTANSRVNPLSKETLQLMKDAGCFMVAFGFESGSDEMLKTLRKGTTVEMNLRAAKWCHEVGLPFWGFYVIGFPWENKEHILATKKLILQSDPDFIEVKMALPFYGTPLYDAAKEFGLLAESPLGSDFFHSAMSGTKYLTQAQVEKLRRNILLSFYLRPKYVFRRLGESIKTPRVFGNYIKYGFKMLGNILRRN
ncbi:MAG: B12-binding domain-containing radical SAM protein [Lachnospiraceae bacterium]|nr:B12-binding domain-containing radical SAM protein [Lachnospiraceae bacterium]